MRVTTDLPSVPASSGLNLVDWVLSDENLGANTVTLESSGFTIRFEGIHSGSAMLFREDAGAGQRFVALDAYDKDRIRAMADLFDSNARSMVESIDWQDDEISAWRLAPVMIITLLVAIAAFWIYRQNFT